MKIRIVKTLKEAPEEATQQISFEEDPINYLLVKYPSLKEYMTILMSDAFKDYITGLYVVAPRPTTFKVVLHNNQEFILVWTGKTYICKVEGKKYYLSFLSDKQRATAAIAQLLELGQPIGKPGPSKEEDGVPEEPAEDEGGGEEEGSTGEEETLEEAVKYSKKKIKLKLLQETNLSVQQLTGQTQYIQRIGKILDKIKKGEPFVLDNGKEVVLSFTEPKYEKLFKVLSKMNSQEANQAFKETSKAPNKQLFFKDKKGNKYTLEDLKKTPEFGGLEGSQAEVRERQERGIIKAINSVEGVKILESENNNKLQGVISAEKVEKRNDLGAEPLSDVRLKVKGGSDILVSAKASRSPALGGGGLLGMESLTEGNQNPELKEFTVKFYKDAYRYYRKLIQEQGLEGENLNGTKITSVCRKVPKELLSVILVGNKKMGGPVSYYYVGGMDVIYEPVKRNTLKFKNGSFLTIDEFIAEKQYTFYASIRNRAGEDYVFTDEKVDFNGTSIPKIFRGLKEGSASKARFAIGDPRGVKI
jgi:hypothetical protein